jgi:hypothetical protein
MTREGPAGKAARARQRWLAYRSSISISAAVRSLSRSEPVRRRAASRRRRVGVEVFQLAVLHPPPLGLEETLLARVGGQALQPQVDAAQVVGVVAAAALRCAARRARGALQPRLRHRLAGVEVRPDVFRLDTLAARAGSVGIQRVAISRGAAIQGIGNGGLGEENKTQHPCRSVHDFLREVAN